MCALVETRVLNNVTPQQVVQDYQKDNQYYDAWRKKIRYDATKDANKQDETRQNIPLFQQDEALNMTMISNLQEASSVQEQSHNNMPRKAQTMLRDPSQQSIFSMDSYKRQNLTERSTRRFWERLFDWIEQTWLYQTMYYYAKQYGTKKPSGYTPQYHGYQTSYYNTYSNMRLSRTEQFIRYLVDKYIELRDSFSYSSAGATDASHQDDRRIASDIAARFDRFLMGRQMMHERRYGSNMYRYQQQQTRYTWTAWFWDSLLGMYQYIKHLLVS